MAGAPMPPPERMHGPDGGMYDKCPECGLPILEEGGTWDVNRQSRQETP